MAISDLIAELAKEGIGGLAEYETKLRQNASNRQVFRDLLFGQGREPRAAGRRGDPHSQEVTR